MDPTSTAAGAAFGSSNQSSPDTVAAPAHAPAPAGAMAMEGKLVTDGDDWLAVAATGGRRSDASSSSPPTASPASKSAIGPEAAGRKASGGGWLMAAIGKPDQGPPLENGDRDGAAGGTSKRPAHAEGQKSRSKPGGWMMSAAISSGYVGAAPRGEEAELGDEPRVSRGVDIETQTDGNPRQPAAVPAKAKLPPWAKPWGPPPPKGGAVSDPNTPTEAAAASEATSNPDPSPGGGIGWIKGASVESSGSKPQGEQA